MENLLEYIEGQSSENLTSAILAYLLNNKEQGLFLRYFLARLFPYDSEMNESLIDIEVSSQDSLNSYGISDLLIESDDFLIVIENKFYAAFSKGDQVKRYVEYLKKYKGSRKAVFLLLTPKNRAKYYWSELEKQIKINYDKLSKVSGIKKTFLLSDESIEIIWISWERILKDFECGNILVTHLSDYIKNKYLINTKLSEEEISLINKNKIPLILEKLWGIVDKVKDQLANEFDTKRTTQSRLFYGFNIDNDWGEIWFGVYMVAWEKYESPFILQLREDWISMNYNGIDIDSELKEIGFQYNEDLEYIFPIKIADNDSIGVIYNNVKKCLENINNILKMSSN